MNHPQCQTVARKSDFQRLVDVGIEGAEIMEMADGLLSESSLQSPWQVLERIQQLRDSLERWKESSILNVQNGPIQALERNDTTVSGLANPLLDRGLRGFPKRIPDVAGPHAYEYVHDMRLIQIYYTIKLSLLITLLGNSQLRPLITESYDFSSLTAMQAGEEANQAAGFVILYAQMLSPGLWPTFGYMFEIWSVEVAAQWYCDFASGLGCPDTVYLAAMNLDTCQSLLRDMRKQMSDDGRESDASLPFRGEDLNTTEWNLSAKLDQYS